jgi:hypothetical protein
MATSGGLAEAFIASSPKKDVTRAEQQDDQHEEGEEQAADNLLADRLHAESLPAYTASEKSYPGR